ncbi:IPT/TIG domain-containing protein [Spirosoma pollinicola]|uniref:Cell shape determination protein CcmA n=1 Tax=Spirosoma pollinicola TaxID=2057025 RepID=A0A2K8YYC8_9BACT|nr:IPT/TIG domain-containing protein [Spirosoma pollinicola]AUD02584.1 cell shape determination protein CcmA [Spirosoma pollinicola]
MKSTFLLFFLCILSFSISSCRVQHSPPELVKLSINQAYVDQAITVTGYQFGSSPSVIFGAATVAPIVSNDETTIRLTVPRVAPGKTQIRVQTEEGTSDPLLFTVLQPGPIVNSIQPTNGLPGTEIIITGDYLNQIKRIRFNDSDAVIKDSTAQKLTIVVPVTVPRGPTFLYIETVGGEVGNRFTVAGTPQIISVSPLNTKPGAELVILGKNFTDGIVSINGLTTDKALTTIKDTEIRTIIPATATSGKVVVRVFETLVATSTDTVKIFQPPFITHLLASDGYAGEKIIVEGNNMSEVSTFAIDNVPASFRLLNSRQVEVTVPALPASKQVSVSASGVGGNTSATDPFFYYLAPSALVLNPARQLPGKNLTISGKDLYRITSVTISGITVPITSRNEGIDLLVGIPPTAVSGPVTVTSKAGTASAPLTLVQQAVVTDIIPLKARPGERVVLRGNFLMNAQILFTGSATAAADGGKNEETERWVTVPADAQTGPLKVTNLTNTTITTTPFTVLRLISAVDFTLKTGKVGDEIILTGQNMATVQEIRFSNGGSVAAKFVLEGTTARVTVPTGAVTGQICLTNGAGTSCTSAIFTVTK